MRDIAIVSVAQVPNVRRAVVEGRVKGYQYIDYVFPAGAGESLTAKLTTDSTANYFNLMAPGENETARCTDAIGCWLGGY